MESFLSTARNAFGELSSRADDGLQGLMRRLDQPLDLNSVSAQVLDVANAAAATVGVSSTDSEAAEADALRRALHGADVDGYAASRPARTDDNTSGTSFRLGDEVEIWSESKKAWIRDAVVRQVAQSEREHLGAGEGYTILAGSVLVVYGGSSKWVPPYQFETHLRKRVKASEPTGCPLSTQIFAQARVAAVDSSKDKSAELQSIELGCRMQRCKFKDPDFGARARGRITQWCRPQDIQCHDGRAFSRADVWQMLGGPKSEVDWQLFRDSPQAEDVQQGELGNCWFISSLAVLAEFQGGRFIRMLFPGQTAPSQSGAYLVRLCLGGEWRDIIIDDRLPCVGGSGYYTQLAYCVTSRLQLWASLIEKAFAKACGSYEAIESGQTEEALGILTGWPCTRIDFDRASFDRDILWATLSSSRDAHYLMTCSTGSDRAANQAVGLVPNHAYSLMDICEVIHDSKGVIKFVKIRNPHAKSKWCGDWSDKSPLWTQDLRQQVGYDAHGSRGMFFMEFSDFLRWFETCTICSIRGMEWHESRVPLSLPSCDIPCAGLMLEPSDTAQCSFSLWQPEQRTRKGPLYTEDLGALACIGFVIVCFDGSRKDGTAVAVAKMKCRSAISAECWLQRDCSYLLLPLSLHAGVQVPVVCSCMSSKAVTMVERSFDKEAARAAWVAFVRYSDKKPVEFHGARVWTASSGSTVVAFAENRAVGYFGVELTFKGDPPGLHCFSRGTPATSDWLSRGFGQLLQIVLPDREQGGSIGWETKFRSQMWGPNQSHQPDVGSDAKGIHAPFKLNTARRT